jgi:outer membrane protein assembly factor BamC
VVAPQSVGAFRLERLGNERWLSTTLSPEAVFPQVRAFWKDNGFTLSQDRADAGVLETDWAENRAKLPNDIIRNTIGKVFDAAYSTGELDKFTTRVERTATGSDIFITHRGMVEVYVGDRRDVTTWQHRPTDPQLEATFLSRLMVKLGGKEEAAKTMVASTGTAAPSGPARARRVEGAAAPTLQVDDGFDRAWRRVGIALDRSGFTVEDRDRGQGLYFVRYVDPASPAARSRDAEQAVQLGARSPRTTCWRSTASRSARKARRAPSPSSIRRGSPRWARRASGSSPCSSKTCAERPVDAMRRPRPA